MIIYIHGFAGSGLGVKAQAVRAYFGREAMAPSLPHIPELAFDTLDQLVGFWAQREPVGLIGSSLGGFYAWALAERHGIKAVLINPSVKPYETLDLWKGFVRHFHDLSSFEWNDRHIRMLKSLIPKSVTPQNYLLMLQKDDELLDYRVALETFAGAKTVVETGGGHSFDGFENYLEKIKRFLEDRSL